MADSMKEADAPERTDLVTARRWRVVVIALGGLLVTVVVAGVLALLTTMSVGQVVDRTLQQDVQLEDEAEDVHVRVRGDIQPWRLNRIRRRLAELALQLETDEERKTT